MNEMPKTLILDPAILRPKLEQAILHCSNCDKPQARWDMMVTDPGPSCTKCEGENHMTLESLPPQEVCTDCAEPWPIQGEEARKLPEPHVESVCALCVLYETPWGKDRRERLDGMIQGVERAKAMTFLRDSEGRMLSCVDADRILAGVAMTSRMFMMGRKFGDGPIPKQPVEESEDA